MPKIQSEISLKELAATLAENLTGPLTEAIEKRFTKKSRQVEQPDQGEGKKYLTRNDLCTMFDISLPTVDSLVKKGELKTYRIAGRRIVFLADDVDQYVKSQRFA